MSETTTKRRSSTRSKPAPEQQPEQPIEQLATHELTESVLRELRRPFTPAAIRFKPQTANLDSGKGLATFYIDARLAAERLNAVVGPEGWADAYRVLFEANPGAHREFQFPVECSLTVRGVTKADVGVYQKASADDKALKSAYSDALKRAAVKFGVGAFLYACPKTFGQLKIVGEGQRRKAVGFTPQAEQQLRKQYEAWLRSDACRAHFGEPLDHGDVLSDDEAEAAGDEPIEQQNQPEPKPAASGRSSSRKLVAPDHADVAKMKQLASQVGYSDEQIENVCNGHRTRAQSGEQYEAKWVAETIADLQKQLAEREQKAAA